jgi:hypothetical protein
MSPTLILTLRAFTDAKTLKLFLGGKLSSPLGETPTVFGMISSIADWRERDKM